jgi:predicted NAD/FAD-dependent oxidoreductase
MTLPHNGWSIVIDDETIGWISRECVQTTQKKPQQDDASHLCVPHRGPPFDPKFAAIEQIEYRKSLGATETRNGETRFELVSAVLLDGPR